MLNQPEINSYQQHIWRQNRQMLIGRVERLCSNNNVGFITDFTKNKFDRPKIVQMWLCDLLPSAEVWQTQNEKCKRAGVKMFVFTDNFIDLPDFEFVKFYSDPTLHSIFGVHHDPVEVNRSPSKLYNCFIQRTDSVRQSWFYFLHLKGLLGKGYVSFLLKQLSSYSSKTGVELFDYIHEHFQLGNVPSFHQAYTELRNQVPYRNFLENLDLTQYIQDSKYSLVLETYATDPATDRWLIGEKAIRAMCYPSTPLLFMQHRAVEKLKSIGFQIDDHDTIDTAPWVDRQKQLLEIIEQDAVEFNPTKLYNRSMHNRDVCLKWQQRYQRDNYFDEFLTQVLE